MNKEHFNQLVDNYSKLDNQFKGLEKLMHEYPYSQPVRMLNVKSSSLLSKKEFQERLALAAFYTTDRNVLRSLIENGQVPSDQKAIPNRVKSPKPVKKVTKKKPSPVAKPVSTNTIDAEKLREEVLKNLELLQQQKHSFLMLDELEVKRKPKKVTPSTRKVTPKPANKKPVTKPSSASKRKPQPTGNTGKKVNKKELIDKFIADEPRITPKKVMSENQSDLSKASSELKEDLVSENLAVIFARQGKTSKAIEIYKKLIWKFPQKKASFAAQIEELKKKKG